MKNASNGISIERHEKKDLHVVHLICLRRSYCNVERGKRKLRLSNCRFTNEASIDRQEKNHSVQSVYERYMQLQAVKYVDEIMLHMTLNKV